MLNLNVREKTPANFAVYSSFDLLKLNDYANQINSWPYIILEKQNKIIPNKIGKKTPRYLAGIKEWRPRI